MAESQHNNTTSQQLKLSKKPSEEHAIIKLKKREILEYSSQSEQSNSKSETQEQPVSPRSETQKLEKAILKSETQEQLKGADQKSQESQSKSLIQPELELQGQSKTQLCTQSLPPPLPSEPLLNHRRILEEQKNLERERNLEREIERRQMIWQQKETRKLQIKMQRNMMKKKKMKDKFLSSLANQSSPGSSQLENSGYAPPPGGMQGKVVTVRPEDVARMRMLRKNNVRKINPGPIPFAPPPGGENKKVVALRPEDVSRMRMLKKKNVEQNTEKKSASPWPFISSPDGKSIDLTETPGSVRPNIFFQQNKRHNTSEVGGAIKNSGKKKSHVWMTPVKRTPKKITPRDSLAYAEHRKKKRKRRLAAHNKMS